MKKEEWEKIIGHNIRNDTYLILERMSCGEEYDEVIEDLENNREKYKIKSDTCLVKLKTIQEYLQKAENILPKKKTR